MKKILIAIFIFSLVCFGIYSFFSQKEFLHSRKSPDGKYIVEIYKEKSFFAAPGDGGISGSLGYIKLLDENGDKIGDTSDCPPFFLSDIELDWEIGKNKYISYTKGEGINLKTGKCN
ncbi:DUF5412 domain-containing protein [Epilithonimonas zeae]|uniref:DUF5412 domain-containing protein n=1 Tax=Epilithonimonas zeae TaxID=1416779 RepID=UPI00200CEA69|nr:DUF5412 domain-containing protein [Epilithonimonas zeae]UQB68099.1 hypothetical protein KI430_13825 [Epilithonimonas zeae]